MCGIVGYISKWKYSGFTYQQQKIFGQLLYVGAVRGVDATGVISVLKDGSFAIAKEAQDSYMFAGSYANSQVDKDNYSKGVAIIGHNRAKTIGENKDENAHPFVEDKTFAMVHNGTLSGHKKFHDTEVDSHALTILLKEAMDEDDWKSALEKALGSVHGAYAVVWYDQKRNQICAIRNSQRTLAVITTGSGWVLSSEPAMGTWIVGRNNETVAKVEMLDIDCLYTFDLKEQGGDYSKTNLSLKFPKLQVAYTNGVENLPKSSVKTTTVTATQEVGNPFINTDKTPLSKNAFKKVRASIINKALDFWIEDYVDVVNDNKGVCIQALLMGESKNGAYDLCEVNHIIRTTVDLKEVGLKESDLFGDVRISGRVYEVEYDKETQAAIVRLDKIHVEEIKDGYKFQSKTVVH
jgi:Glutamine amidotransferase domain